VTTTTTEARLRQNLITLFDTFSRETGRMMSTIGKRVYGDPRLYDNLKRGQNFTVRAYDKIVGTFNAIWPHESVPWPDGVDRIELLDVPVSERKPRRPSIPKEE